MEQVAHQEVFHQGRFVADWANPFWFPLIHAGGGKKASNTFKVKKRGST